MKEESEFESIKNEAIEPLKVGKSLVGKEGTFGRWLYSKKNAALESEMDTHISYRRRTLNG